MGIPRVPADCTRPVGSADSDVVRLCGYLQVDPRRFMSEQQRYFARLTELLRFHRVLGSSDCLDASTFRSAVRQFQHSVGRPADGIPDEDTLWELNYSWTMSHRRGLVALNPDGSTPVSRAVNAESPAFLQVRDDVAEAVRAWQRDLQVAGVAIRFAAARRRPFDPSGRRCADLIHYAATSVDLHPWFGTTTRDLRALGRDRFVVTDDGDAWPVWARTHAGEEVSLDAFGWSAGQLRSRRVHGPFLDVTAVAAVHGLAPTRACSPTRDRRPDCWHFEHQAAVVAGISQFGCEVLRLRANSEVGFQSQEWLWQQRKQILGVGRGWRTRPIST